MAKDSRVLFALLTLLAGSGLAGLGLAGCDVDRGSQELQYVHRQTSPQDATLARDAVPPGETVRIASFNIQVFGQSKLGKPHVMDVLADVVRRFDVVAIQEIRSADQALMPQFVELINAGGSPRYDFVIGPRLGRTVSKEQYAYVFDTTRIELDRGSVYTVDDRNDLLHRPPLVARFRVRGPPEHEAFTFTLVNIHTDPDETKTELDALADVFRSVQQNGSGEDDVILLGDLNESEHRLGELANVPNIDWAISGMTTNTRANRAYDNLLFDRTTTTEYTGNSGVLNLMREYDLTLEEALEVSDHYPVWAEFSIYEGPRNPVADHDQAVRR